MKTFTTPLTQLSIFLFATLVGVTSAQAQKVWVGGGDAGVNWDDGFNWQGGVPSNNGSTLEFAGTSETTNFNDFDNYAFGGISFTNTGDGENFTLQGLFFNLQGAPGISTADVASGSQIVNTIENSIVLGVQSQALNIGANSTLNLNGIISHLGASSFGLTKSNAGTAVLAGDNTYTGATLVNGSGTLIVNGDQTAATGNVIVSNTATLGGFGTVGGEVEIGTDAFIAAGNSIGTLTTVGGVDLMGTMLVELDGTGGGSSDLLNVGGIFDITAGSVQFSVTGAALDDNAYVFANYATLNPIVGPFAAFSGVPTGYRIDYNYLGGNQIALVAVPEPGALAFLGFCLVGVAARRRRQS